MNKQVDILLAAYNGERFIHEQISSIFNQSYPYFRLIICDDQSTDSTASIIATFKKTYPDRIHILSTDRKLGVNQCFSFLLDHAESEYVMFADQDDIWLEHKIESALSTMNQLERTFGVNTPLLVHSNLKVVNVKLDIINPSFWNYCHLFPKNGSSLNRLIVQNIVTGCSLMVNRSLVNIAKPIPKEAIQHDWWLALVAAALGHIKEIEKPGILYRQHSGNSLGAIKYNAFTYFFRRMKTPLEADKAYRIKNINQTKVLMDRYGYLLSSEKNKMLKDYCDLINLKFLEAIPFILKYKFYKHGFSRNFISLIPKGVFRRLWKKISLSN